MPLPENKQAVVELKNELEKRILGAELPRVSCCCGTIRSGPAKPVEVVPGGERYPGQETDFTMWSVRMRDVRSREPARDYNYSTGLTSFIDRRELEMLFTARFPKRAR